MILLVYSVYDKAVDAFLPPMFMRAKGEAIRSFTVAVQNEEHQFAKHAEDYFLAELGTFNDLSGVFVCHEPVRVISALECVEPVEDPARLKRPGG